MSVRAAVETCAEAAGLPVYERDEALHDDYLRELRELLQAADVLPSSRLFVMGRYLSGAEACAELVENRKLAEMLRWARARMEACAAKCGGSCKGHGRRRPGVEGGGRGAAGGGMWVRSRRCGGWGSGARWLLLGRQPPPLPIVALAGSTCRGIVESSHGSGAIEIGRERGFGDVGCSCSEMDTSLPSFGSHDGGVILRAAINHYEAISPDNSDGSRRDRCSRRDWIMP